MAENDTATQSPAATPKPQSITLTVHSLRHTLGGKILPPTRKEQHNG